MRKIELRTTITTAAAWRLNRLALAWNCTSTEVLERITREAAVTHKQVLFPPAGTAEIQEVRA